MTDQPPESDIQRIERKLDRLLETVSRLESLITVGNPEAQRRLNDNLEMNKGQVDFKGWDRLGMKRYDQS